MGLKMKLVKVLKKVCYPITLILAGVLFEKGIETGHPAGMILFATGGMLVASWGAILNVGLKESMEELRLKEE